MSWFTPFKNRGGDIGAVREDPPMTAGDVAAPVAANPAFTEAGFGMSSPSRVKGLPPVSSRTAARHATVFSCCNVIAGDLAKVPLVVHERVSEDRYVKVNDHPANYLLNIEAAPGVSAMTLRFALVYSFALRGLAFAYGPRDGGGELELIEPILPDACQLLRLGRDRFYEFEDGAGVFRRAPGRAMVHMRYMALDGWAHRSPIEVAAESMGLAFAGQEAAAKSASGTQIKAFAKLGVGLYADDATYDRAKRRLRSALDDEGSVPIVGGEDDIKNLALSSADMELLESRKFDREQIIGLYRVPPSKVQMLEHGVKANGPQQAVDYRTDCLLHWGGFVAAQAALGILTDGERRRGLVLRHDYDVLDHATAKEAIDADTKAAGGPIQTVDERRAKRGLPPIPGGNVLYPPTNMTRKDETKDKSKEGDE